MDLAIEAYAELREYFRLFDPRHEREREIFTRLGYIDMQHGDLHYDPETELGRRYPEIACYWNARIADVVVPNVGLLLDYFRKHSLKVFFTRNGAMTASGEELTSRLKAKLQRIENIAENHKGKPDYEITHRLAPLENELVVDKLTSGAFTASFLDHALRNMGISDLVITGILTDQCVLGTARTAAELGYHTVICENACASLTEKAHIDALVMHTRTFGKVFAACGYCSERYGKTAWVLSRFTGDGSLANPMFKVKLILYRN